MVTGELLYLKIIAWYHNLSGNALTGLSILQLLCKRKSHSRPIHMMTLVVVAINDQAERHLHYLTLLSSYVRQSIILYTK